MTTRTKADLRNRVLRDMNVLDIGQSASATDAARVDDIVQEAIEELADEKLDIFDPSVGTTSSNIPARIFGALADFVRYHAMPSYGLAKDEALRQSALKRLRRSILPGSSDNPAPLKFF